MCGLKVDKARPPRVSHLSADREFGSREKGLPAALKRRSDGEEVGHAAANHQKPGAALQRCRREAGQFGKPVNHAVLDLLEYLRNDRGDELFAYCVEALTRQREPRG
jgi:hypothetical protein